MDPTLMIIATLLPFVMGGGVLGIVGAVKASRRGNARRLRRRIAERGWSASSTTPALTSDAAPDPMPTDLRVTGGEDVTEPIGLTGTWGGHEVKVQAEHTTSIEGNQMQYFASMRLPVDWADRVWIQSSFWPTPEGPRVELPVDAFQTPLSAIGEAASVVAVCNPAVRAGLAGGPVAIQAGYARHRLKMVTFSMDRVGEALATLQQICDAVPPISRVEALEQIVLHDPWPSMRGVAFEALVGLREPMRDELVEQALASELVDLRARAAVYRGPAAIDTARAVLLDLDAAPAPRAHVAALVAANAPSDEVAEAIARAVEHDHPSRAALWLDAAQYLKGAQRALVARGLHARIDRDAAVRPIYYRAAADFGDDGWYPALVKGFDEAEDEVILAALGTVAELASLSRVEHLKQYASESTGIGASVRVDRPWSRKLKRAADVAIARIQERCGGAAGGLAIADHAEGALGMADDA